jgi:hypothetical protein
MHEAKAMNRVIAVLAWIVAVCFPVGLLTAALGSVEAGLALVAVSFALLVVVIVLALLAFVSVRCRECGGRFFSALYPVWPFESACARCGASAVR